MFLLIFNWQVLTTFSSRSKNGLLHLISPTWFSFFQHPLGKDSITTYTSCCKGFTWPVYLQWMLWFKGDNIALHVVMSDSFSLKIAFCPWECNSKHAYLVLVYSGLFWGQCLEVNVEQFLDKDVFTMAIFRWFFIISL